MAFRFTITEGDKSQESAWYVEHGAATAPMVMSHLRNVFPNAAVSVKRENMADAKDPNEALEDFKALKEK